MIPLKRKLIKIGGGKSRGVILPYEWLDYYEAKLGKPIRKVYLTDDGGEFRVYLEEPNPRKE